MVSFASQPDAKTYKQQNGVNVGVVWNVLKMHCDATAASWSRRPAAVSSMR